MIPQNIYWKKSRVCTDLPGGIMNMTHIIFSYSCESHNVSQESINRTKLRLKILLIIEWMNDNRSEWSAFVHRKNHILCARNNSTARENGSI